MATVYEYGAPPVKGSAWSFETSLVDVADTDNFKANPTLAAGDVLVNGDGGSFTNIDSLPTVISSTEVLTVALSTSEMNYDRVVVKFKDAAGDEWQGAVVTIMTVAATYVTLASDGLDNISAAEPSAKPTTFAGWVMWLVQRQRRSTLTGTTLTVRKEDSTVITTQTVSDDGSEQVLGAPS